MRATCLVIAAVVAIGCAPRRVSREVVLAAPPETDFEAAQALTLAARNKKVLERVQLRATRPAESSAARKAALREARALVKQAATAPAGEQEALERRAGELLRTLESF